MLNPFKWIIGKISFERVYKRAIKEIREEVMKLPWMYKDKYNTTYFIKLRDVWWFYVQMIKCIEAMKIYKEYDLGLKCEDLEWFHDFFGYLRKRSENDYDYDGKFRAIYLVTIYNIKTLSKIYKKAAKKAEKYGYKHWDNPTPSLGEYMRYWLLRREEEYWENFKQKVLRWLRDHDDYHRELYNLIEKEYEIDYDTWKIVEVKKNKDRG